METFVYSESDDNFVEKNQVAKYVTTVNGGSWRTDLTLVFECPQCLDHHCRSHAYKYLKQDILKSRISGAICHGCGYNMKIEYSHALEDWKETKRIE